MKIIDEQVILENVKKKIHCGVAWHGISLKDYDEIDALVKFAKATDTSNKTEFPDFECASGFIEHFHVTSGESSKKGYKITTDKSKDLAQHSKFMEEKSENPSNNFSEFHTSFSRKDSIENFHKSFKKAWENHIQHLHKYNGKKHISCFLISSDDVLRVKEKLEDENEIIYGDLTNDNIIFCLSYDLELLNYIYSYKEDIDYVIYYNENTDYVEILKTINIPYIMNRIHNKTYKIHSPNVICFSDSYGIHLPKHSGGTKQ